MFWLYFYSFSIVNLIIFHSRNCAAKSKMILFRPRSPRFEHILNPIHMLFRSTYQVLQLFCIIAPGRCVLSPCTQGHMVMGTHWPWWSCISPGGHWQPGTHILRLISPPLASQLQLSEQQPPQARPHSWYTCPPEHWTAGNRRGGTSNYCSLLHFSNLQEQLWTLLQTHNHSGHPGILFKYFYSGTVLKSKFEMLF